MCSTQLSDFYWPRSRRWSSDNMSASRSICPRCSTTVYFNEQKIAMGKTWHIRCFCCANKQCNRRLDSSNLTEHKDEIYCKSCYGKLFGPKGYGYGGGAGVLSMDTGDAYKNGPPTSNIPATAQAHVAPLQSAQSKAPVSRPQWGRTDTCPRCGKAVYMAEKMMGGGAAWHKSTCFNCKECHKNLESTTLCEREGEIYCKSCYGKMFGPKGYGYGLGAGTLQMSK